MQGLREWGCLSLLLHLLRLSLQSEHTLHPSGSRDCSDQGRGTSLFLLSVLLRKPWAEMAVSHLPCALVRRGRAGTMVKLLQLIPCACPSNCQHP